MLDDQPLAELTRRFYEKADLDPILGPVILAALPVERRAEHFAVFRDFWAKMLFGTEGYGGNALTAHAGLVLEARHFERWLEIFAANFRCYFDLQRGGRRRLHCEHQRYRGENLLNNFRHVAATV